MSNWIAALLNSIIVMVIIEFIQIFIDYDLNFLQGWLACGTYFYTLKFAENKEGKISELQEQVKTLETELDYEKKESHIRIEELKSQITTERCMK